MPNSSADFSQDALQHDVLIIGSGAAGLLLALHLAPHARVAVLSKRSLHEGNTYYAQGGIAAVLDEDDSVEAHVADTLDAGAGLGHPEVIRHVAEQAPAAIAELVERGVAFTRDGHDGRLHLTREGGHSHRRIVHAADATGQAVELTLAQQVRLHPNIDLYEDHIAIDLITARKPTHRGGQRDAPNAVQGAYVLDAHNDRVRTFSARAVALATGGASKVYLYTSNPDLATGDGIAMAWRAGCRVANLEFNQFHPTCLYHPQAKSFLITEAVRGEGGRLLLPDGTPFMQRFDRRGELAPRDIVARAIDHEMKRLGADHLLLDISFRGPEFVREHFPTVYARVLEFGFDLSREPIPIVPAAHYTCGGVVTDLHGRTDVPQLYAIGETAHTGLHGANRMASNSLLECLVFARNAAQDILQSLPQWQQPHELKAWDESRVTDSDEEVVVSHNWDELRRFMWDYVGIVRTTKRLERAQRRIALLQQEIAEYYGHFRVTHNLIELRNLTLVAELIIRCALERKESRGLHFNRDYPDQLTETQDTILTP
jgi:L-aspartate oxidase